MTRMSKQMKRRHVSPRKHRAPSKKTGPKKDALEQGFKPHENALAQNMQQNIFIPKIK